jgi:uncharacterized protein DUF2752
MRVFLKKRERGRIEFGIIYGSIALLVLLAVRFSPIASLAPSCAFKGVLGVPCPTCGSTRAVVQLSHGDLFSALAMNPVITLVVVFAVIFFFYSLTALIFHFRRIGFVFTEREKNTVRIAVVLLLLVQWGWLIRTL